MRIIHLIYSLCSGGAERFVVSLSNQLVGMKYEVEICMLLDDKNKEMIFNKAFLNPEVRFHSMHFSPGFSLKKVSVVEEYIKSRHPDVVHCHLNVIPYIFKLAYCDHSIRFVHTLHNIAEKAVGTKFQYCLNKFYYRRQIIQPVMISKKCLDSFKTLYHLNNAPYINNGCNRAEPSPEYHLVCTEIERFKGGKDIPLFIHIGRFHPQKNQELLIDAFNELSNEGYTFSLLIIGNGFQTKEAEKLKNKACEKIHFLGEKKNVGDYLLNADAFCLTSYFEGLPISLLEALSAGVTPICTPVGGIPDVIIDNVTGFLSEGTELFSYLDALHRFLKKKIDPFFLQNYFNEHFSMQTCAENYIAIYESQSLN